MGVSSSKTPSAKVRQHPLLNDEEYSRLCALYGSFGDGSIKDITEELSLPECDESFVATLFSTTVGMKVPLKVFVDTVALLSRGSTSDMRRTLFAGGVDLKGMFEFVGHVRYGPIEFKTSAWLNGLKLFAIKQHKIAEGASPILVDDSIEYSNETLENVQISFGSFNLWCSAMLPTIQDGISARMVSKMILGLSSQEGLRAEELTRTVASSETLDIPDMIALAIVESKCKNPPDLLFSSSKDGMSFDMLAKSVTGYAGATVMVIKDSESNVFGAFSSIEWEESSLFFGKSSSFLFSFYPVFQILRARSDGSTPGTGNFQYLKCRGRTGHQGIGFGGDEGNLRLWLDRDLDNCFARSSDLTYESGRLRWQKDPSFRPMAIEFWGFGGSEALASQVGAHQDVAKMQLDRRKVDRKKFAESSFDREMLLGKTFAAQNQASNR